MGAFSDTEFDLEPGRVKELVEAGEVQLVDVREPYEWEAGRIAGAKHIELEHLAGQACAIRASTSTPLPLPTPQTRMNATIRSPTSISRSGSLRNSPNMLRASFQSSRTPSWPK